MSDVNANIKVSIDSSQALAELKSLQRQISLFHTNIAKSSAQAALAQKTLQTDLLNAINATGRFSAEMRTIKTSTEAFTNSLEKNKFSIRQYFRYAAGSTKTFGKLFRSEFDTISQVAEDRVKKMQTQYIKMGRDARGVMQAIAVTPKDLNLKDFQTQMQITAQRQQLFNQLLRQGSTNLLNFGKNTQWAGRQLMVGFTLPLAALGSTAAKTFMDMETAAIKFRKVYGDLFTPASETQQALKDIQELGGMFTKYGIAVSQTVSLAADAAAAGFQGLDLQRQVTEATRLQVLGQIDQQQALETTIALQNAFKLSNEDLTDSINFLNAVENQTVTSLDDITTAIPKVAPVIQQLGGNVKDLAFFLTAMKQGGVNASEGANALKSGLAALINPTEKASKMLEGMGVNITKIVESNQGNLRATVVEFAKALDTLDPLTRARAIEQLFGKFQFARLSTLFSNVISDGTQASRVLELASASASDLATTAEKELGMTSQSAMNKFKKAVEDLKVALVPVGEAFLQAVTPVLESVTNILDKFKDMSSGSKKAIMILVTAIGGLGPILLMTFGLLANGLANILKLFGMLRGGYLKLGSQSRILGEQTQYLTSEELEAAAVASSLDQAHAKLIQTFNVEAEALRRLREAYLQAAGASQRFAINNPGMMSQGKVRKYAKGGEVFMVPGSGNEDTVPSMLTPGEIVVPKKQSKKYFSLLKGIIADNIPGYKKSNILDLPTTGRVTGGRFIQKEYSSLAMFGPGNTATGAGIDLTWMKESNVAGSNFAAAIKASAMEAMGVRQTAKAYANFWTGLDPVLDGVFEIYKSGITPDVQHIAEVGDKQYPLIIEHINDLELQTRLTAEQAEQMRIAVRKLLQPLQSDKTQRSLQRIDLATDEFGNTIVKRPTSERIGQTSKLKVRSATLREMQRRGLAGNMAGMSYAHLSRESTKPTYVEPRTSASATMAEKSIAERLRMGESFKQGQVISVGQNARAVERDAVLAGKRNATAYNNGLSQGGLTDIYLESRDRKSPHPMTVKDGRDDAMSYEKARRNSLTTYGTTGPVDPISKSIRRQNEKRLKDVQRNMARPRSFITENIGTNATGSLEKMNSALRGASFGLMSVSTAGSMASGKLGEISGQIMKYSGLLFGLMTITELLTKESFIQFIQKRKENALSAVAGLSQRGGAIGAIASKGGPLSIFLKAGTFVTKFLGPIGLVTTALLGTYKIINMVNAAREKERQKLEAFSDVLSTTSKQTEFLQDYFNFVPVKGSLETFGDALNEVSTQIRSERDTLKASKEFQDAYGQTIRQVSGMTDKEATAALKLKSLELLSKGMSQKSVETLIETIKEEAKKTDVTIDFKSLTIDKEGLSSVGKELMGSLKDFEKQYSSSLRKVYQSIPATKFGERDQLITKFIPDEKGRAALKNASAGVKSYSESINRLATAGRLDFETFTSAMTTMSSEIDSAIDDPILKIKLLKRVIKSLDEDFGKATKNIDNYKNIQLLLSAALAGVKDNLILTAAAAFATADQLNKVADANLRRFGIKDTTAEEAYLRSTAIANERTQQEILNDSIKNALERYKELNNEKNKFNQNNGKDNALTDLIKRTEEIKRQIEVFKELRKRGIEAAVAQEMASNVDLAKLLQQTGYVGENWRNAIRAIKEYAKQQKELEKTIAVGGGAGEYQQYLFKRAEAFITLQEHLIDMQYKGQLKSIDNQLASLDTQINAAKKQEELINEKFDKQISALNTIKSLNDAIAAQEKQRLTIADALSRGDISAAAMAVQEARSQQAAASMEAAQQGLTTSREQAVANLGIKNIQNQIDALNEQKKVIEDTIQKQKESITYFGMTADQIRDAARALDLANDAGIDINNETFLNNLLKGATGDASALKTVMVQLQSEAKKLFEELQKLRTTFLTTGGGANGVGVGPKGVLGGGAGPTSAAAAYGYTDLAAYRKTREDERRMYGGIIKKYAVGGMVGGTGMIDKVPTLLTPGEYVVNKNAAKRFGPLLKSINESKYPNSLSLGGASTAVMGVSDNSVKNNNTSVYNYSLNVNAGSSASADDIARVVMTQIRNMDAQRLRGSRY